ncbi:unnamed protein product [Prunus armeniaca]|uniref:Uncharacterized protein n=1 Tax=Prunus armeniaca TaxID=36596 RepID=A0A6J5VJT4_PRUAR|nr:unnamed protein product [Prunus armeniaca]
MSGSALIGSVARLMMGWIRNRGGGGFSRTLSSLNGYFSPFLSSPLLRICMGSRTLSNLPFGKLSFQSFFFFNTQTRDLTLVLTMVEPGISLLPFTMVYWSGWPRLGS